ncbi:serine-rich adhesin for platelets-like [Haliotis asinina]|uniref:serine-rich adhesin for platelets-like n=1 Tax=Haliotis asinina TaxID=109174 RepID=UPI003531AD71
MAHDVVQEDDFDLYTDMICEDSKLALVACRSLPKSVPVPVSPLGPSPDLKHMSPDMKPPSPDLKPPSTNLKPLSQDVKPQSLVPNKPPPEEESLDLYSDIITDNNRSEQSSSSGDKLLVSTCAGLSSSVGNDGVETARSGSSVKPGEEDSNLDLYTEILSDELQQRHDSQIQLEQKYSTAVARIQDLEAELQKLKETEEKTRAQNIVIKQNITSLLLTSKTELQRKDREISRLNLLLSKRGAGNFRGKHSEVRKYIESSSSQQKVPRGIEDDTDPHLPRRGRIGEFDNQKRKRNETINEGTPKRQKIGNAKHPVTPEPKDCRKPWSHSQSPDKPDRRTQGPAKERRNDSKSSDHKQKDFAEEEDHKRRSKTSRERDHCDRGTTEKSRTGPRKYDRDSRERDKYLEAGERDIGLKKSSKDGPADERSRTRNKSSSGDKVKRIESSRNDQNYSGDLRNILKRKRDGMEQKTVEIANRKRHSSKTESISERLKNTNYDSKACDKEPRPSDKGLAGGRLLDRNNDSNLKCDKQAGSENDESFLKGTSVKTKTKYDAETSSAVKHNSVRPQTDISSDQDKRKGGNEKEFEPSSLSASGSVMKGDSSNSPTSSVSSSSYSASKEKRRIKPIMLSGKPDVVGDTHNTVNKSCFDSVIHNIEMRERSSFANARVVVMDVKGCPVDAAKCTDDQFLCEEGTANAKDDAMADFKGEHDRTSPKLCAKQDVSKEKVQIHGDVIEHLPMCTVDTHLSDNCVSVDRETVESMAGDLSDGDCSLDLMMEEERCSRTMPYMYVRKCRVQVKHSSRSNSDSHRGSSVAGELSSKGCQEEENMDLSSGEKKNSIKKHKSKRVGKEKVQSHSVGQYDNITKSTLSETKSPVTTGVSSHTTPASVSPKVIEQTQIAVASSGVGTGELPPNNDIKLDHVDRRDPRLDYGVPMKVNNATCKVSEIGITENTFQKSRSENTSTNKLSSHQGGHVSKDGSHVEGPLPVHHVDSRLNGHERPPYHVEPFDFTSFPTSYAKSESEDEMRNTQIVECRNTSGQVGMKCHPENHLSGNVAHNKDSGDINMNESQCDVATKKRGRHLSVSSDVEMDSVSTNCLVTKELSGNRTTLCQQSSVPVQKTNDENVSIDLVKTRSRSISGSQCGTSLPGLVPVDSCHCTFKPMDLSVRSTVRPRRLSVKKAKPFTESSHFRGFSLSEDGALDLSKKHVQRPEEIVVNCESNPIANKVNATVVDQDEPKSKQSSSNNSMVASSPRHALHSGYMDTKSLTLVDLSTMKSNVAAADECDLVLSRQIKSKKDVEVNSSQGQIRPQLNQDTAATVEVKPPCQDGEPASSDKPVNISIQSMDRSDTSEELDITSPKRDGSHESTSEESCTSDSKDKEDVISATSQDISVSSSKTVSSTQVSSCSDNPKSACSSETVTTLSSVPSKTTTSSCDSSVSAADSDSVSSSEEDEGSNEEESSEDVCVTDDQDAFHCESSQSEMLMKTLSCESLPLKNFEKLRHDLLLSDDSSLSYNPESSEDLVCMASRSQMSNDEKAKFKLPDMSTSASARLASSNEPSDKTTSPETVTRKPVTSLDEDTQCSLLSLHAEQFEFDCDQSVHGDQFRSQNGEPATETQVEDEDGECDGGECSEDGEITNDEEGPAVDRPVDEEMSVDLRELLEAKQLLEQKIYGICGRESKKPLSSQPSDHENRHKNKRRDRRLERKDDRSRATRVVDNRRGSKPGTSGQDRFRRKVHGSDPRLDRSSSRHRRDEEPRYHSSPAPHQIPSERRKDSHRNSSPLSSRVSHKDQCKENHRNHGGDHEERPRARGRDFMDSARSRSDQGSVSRHSGRRSNRDKS